MRDRNDFDPENITKSDMNKLAEHIEEYINMLEEVMIIPSDIKEEHGKRIEKALDVSKKLVRKLRKGDSSVFKDTEDWNLIT